MRLSKTERILRLFTDVRPGEGGTAILMFFNIFLVLCAYYLIKPLREGWLSISEIPGLSNQELKAYSAPIQAALLLPAVAAYGQLSARVPRGTLITRATLFCMSNLVLFFLWRPGSLFGSIPGSGLAFYLWVSMFGLFIVAQFWTFAADLYTDERGRRLMPMIAIGATGGAAFGSSIVTPLVESGRFGADVLLLAALIPLVLSIVLTRVVDERERVSERGTPKPTSVPASGDARSGLAMIIGSRFLIAAAAITLLTNWVNTNGENLLYSLIGSSLEQEIAERAITAPDAIAAFRKDGVTVFYGSFFAWVNASALLLQAFVASRLLKYGGFGVLLMLLPVIALVSYAAMAIVPILAVIKVMKIAENSTDYSINNTARNVLWLPASSEMKFKCKPAIDTLFARLGDTLAAATVWFGTRVVILSTRGYSLLTVVLVLLWIATAIVMIREHRRLSESNPSPGKAECQ